MLVVWAPGAEKIHIHLSGFLFRRQGKGGFDRLAQPALCHLVLLARGLDDKVETSVRKDAIRHDPDRIDFVTRGQDTDDLRTEDGNAALSRSRAAIFSFTWLH